VYGIRLREWSKRVFLEKYKKNVSFGQKEANQGGFAGLNGDQRPVHLQALSASGIPSSLVSDVQEKPPCVSVCVRACVLGPSPEPMYYKSSRCKIIFGFSRPTSNYYWHLILFTPFTDPFNPTTSHPLSHSVLSLSLSLSLTHTHTHTHRHTHFSAEALGLNKHFLLGYLLGGIVAGHWISIEGSDLALLSCNTNVTDYPFGSEYQAQEPGKRGFSWWAKYKHNYFKGLSY